MSEWYVVGRDSDPAPGDPGGIRGLASRLLGEADLADRNTGRLRTIAAGDGGLQMEGEYAPRFRDMLGELPGELDKLGRAYRRCGESVRAYADDLEGAKAKAGAALRNGRDAEDRFQGALRQVRTLLPADRQSQVSSGLSLSEFSVESVTTGLDEGLRVQVRSAAARGRAADADRSAARRLADEAARLRGDAEQKAEKGIHDALDSGIKNKSWWEKAWDFVSAPFRSWDAFVDLCKTIAMVAGIVALFISGPIGLALVAIALVASAVVFADDLVKYAKGEVGLGTLALDALGLIPGARGVVSVTKLGRAAVSLGEAFSRGEGGRLLLGGLRTFGAGLLSKGRNMVTAFPHALETARSISGGALKDPKLFARAFNCRWVGRDPIDMATGEMVMQMTDFSLPGILPLVLERTYVSSYHAGHWFGPGWSSFLDQRLEIDQHGVWYAAPGGVLIGYPHLEPGRTVLPDEGARRPLTRTTDGRYILSDPATGQALHFAEPPGSMLDVVLPLSTVIDRNGNRIDLGYDPDTAWLGQVRHSGGYLLDVETEAGLITAFTLRGRTPDEADVELIRYSYDPAGRLSRIYNSSGRPLVFDHDETGRITRWEDRNGTWYSYGYDDQGRVTRTSGAAGCLDGTISYDSERRLTVETDSLGHATSYRFNDAWQITAVTDPLGNTTRQEWDVHHQLLVRTDPLGQATRRRYDGGDLVELARADGTRIALEYARPGLVSAVRVPDGGIWQVDHDERGNVVRRVDPAGAVTHYGYDERGRVQFVQDPTAAVTRYETDPAGLVVAVTDPAGGTTRMVRDALGRVVRFSDQLGASTRLTWTAEGQLSARTYPDGTVEQARYDAEGNLVEFVDALAGVTAVTPTLFDQVGAVVAVDGGRTLYSYDTELRLVRVTDPRGLAWEYEYDAAGRLVAERDFNGGTIRHELDGAGRRISSTNRAGERIDYRLNVAGDIVERRSGDLVESFTYDAVGRLIGASNADTTLAWQRDLAGRVVAESCDGSVVASRYDAVGRRVSRTTPAGVSSLWQYDSAGRCAALRVDDMAVRFDFDAAGREVQRQVGDRVRIEQRWDVANRLVGQRVWAGAEAVGWRDYQYAPDGIPTAVQDATDGSRLFELDPVGRVTAVAGDGWSERYDYDAAGAVTAASWPGDDAQPAAGARDYTGTLVRQAGRTSYQHDRQGRVVLRRQRLLSGGERSWWFRWDAFDRLTEVTTPDGARWSYRYDPLGRRTVKRRASGGADDPGEESRFVWDGFQLAEQYSGGRVTTWNWQPDRFAPLVQRVGAAQPSGDEPATDQARYDAQFYAIVTDLIGAPTELFALDGEAAWRRRASLWGAGQVTAGSADCPLRFPGQYADEESGLHYNVLRHYDPVAGRFASPDPLGLIGGDDPHRYVPNPLAWLDPLGLTNYGPSELPLRPGYTSSPALRGDPYHPDVVAARSQAAQDWVRDTNARAAQKAVRSGQGPREIGRVDGPEESVPGSQWHAQGPGRGSPGINYDGTFHDGNPNWPARVTDWLRGYGWNI